MNVERLEKLAGLLSDLEAHRAELLTPYGERMTFDMGFWVRPANCGTSACAGGWAALYKPFIAEGLHAAKIDLLTTNLCIVFGEYYELGALSHFFDLDHAAANYIFMPSYYPDLTHSLVPQDKGITPEEVVSHIFNVLSGVTHFHRYND